MSQLITPDIQPVLPYVWAFADARVRDALVRAGNGTEIEQLESFTAVDRTWQDLLDALRVLAEGRDAVGAHEEQPRGPR